MHTQLLLPTEVVFDGDSTKVVAEGADGFFCLLPRHIDFVSALVPGILHIESVDGGGRLFGVDEGILVKCGDRVMISVQNAIEGEDLERLRALVEEHFEQLDEHERMARTALARLEAGTIRRFMDMEHQWHE